ncbi:MAG TPA: hypothetical protein VGV35_13160 [Bryobacteraceae bacterium]|nr:hypothetical protein [Bryobacteraceae bacterium]
MSNDESIALVFLTDRGTRERLHIDQGNMADARRLAEQILCVGAGLYTEVEIYAAGRLIETIENGELSGIASDR